MSVSYNHRLKPKRDKGLCGDAERFEENDRVLEEKIAQVAHLIQSCNKLVVYTGAGISTSCGIPDFRGPNGVWTREEQGKSPPPSVRFESAIPSSSHMSLVRLMERGPLEYVVSQNVDGLHLRSGLPRDRLAEVHGNIFMEKCERCGIEYLRDMDVGSVGFALTGRQCDECGQALRDQLLDWDSELPVDDMEKSIQHTKAADLCICLGTSLRIRPVGNFPMRCVRRNGKSECGKLVIVNLQTTHLDRQATVRLFAKCDVVMERVMRILQYDIPVYPYRSPLVSHTRHGVPYTD